MEIQMQKNEVVISQLVLHAQRGFAVVVVGAHGSGKNWLCQLAIKRMGLEPYTICADMLEGSDLHGYPLPSQDGSGQCSGMPQRTPGLFDKLPDGVGLIVDDIHKSHVLKELSYLICNYVRGGGLPRPGAKKVVFICVPPDELVMFPSSLRKPSEVISEYLGPATGETLGLERLVVEVK